MACRPKWLILATLAMSRSSSCPRSLTHPAPARPPSRRPTWTRACRSPAGRRPASRMTLAEKIGQMTQAERAEVDADPTPITDVSLGSCCPAAARRRRPTRRRRGPTWSTTSSARRSTHACTSRCSTASTPCTATATCRRDRLPAQHRPRRHPRPGAGREDRAHHRRGDARHRPQWAFAPCICAARDDRWGRTYECFGEDPALVEQMETAIDGLQGDGRHLADRDRVLATAKHYAGDGDTSTAPANGDYTIDQGIASPTATTSANIALRQYVPAVRTHDVGWSCRPSRASTGPRTASATRSRCTRNQELITDVLKGQMGFDGLRDQRLGGRSTRSPATCADAGRGPASTPASTCSWSPTNSQDFESRR